MSKNPIERIANLLAASGIPSSEIDAFIDWVKNSSPDDVIRAVIRARTRMQNFSSTRMRNEVSHERKRARDYQYVINDIYRLVDQSSMPISEAGERISRELKKMYSDENTQDFDFDRKSGLKRWLSRMMNHKGPNAILNASLNVLKSDNVQRHDWSLDS